MAEDAGRPRLSDWLCKAGGQPGACRAAGGGPGGSQGAPGAHRLLEQMFFRAPGPDALPSRLCLRWGACAQWLHPLQRRIHPHGRDGSCFAGAGLRI